MSVEGVELPANAGLGKLRLRLNTGGVLTLPEAQLVFTSLDYWQRQAQEQRNRAESLGRRLTKVEGERDEAFANLSLLTVDYETARDALADAIRERDQWLEIERDETQVPVILTQVSDTLSEPRVLSDAEVGGIEIDGVDNASQRTFDALIEWGRRWQGRAVEAERERDAARADTRTIYSDLCRIDAEQDAEIATLREQVGRLEGAVEDLTTGHEYWDRNISVLEDVEVFALCERHGYGAVMDSASRLWARKDKNGSFVVGVCRVFARRALAAAEDKEGNNG